MIDEADIKTPAGKIALRNDILGIYPDYHGHNLISGTEIKAMSEFFTFIKITKSSKTHYVIILITCINGIIIAINLTDKPRNLYSFFKEAYLYNKENMHEKCKICRTVVDYSQFLYVTRL